MPSPDLTETETKNLPLPRHFITSKAIIVPWIIATKWRIASIVLHLSPIDHWPSEEEKITTGSINFSSSAITLFVPSTFASLYENQIADQMIRNKCAIQAITYKISLIIHTWAAYGFIQRKTSARLLLAGNLVVQNRYKNPFSALFFAGTGT